MASMDDPRGEPQSYMARAALLLASLPADTINGRVTYSQQILGEYGLLDRPTGRAATLRQIAARATTAPQCFTTPGGDCESDVLVFACGDVRPDAARLVLASTHESSAGR